MTDVVQALSDTFGLESPSGAEVNQLLNVARDIAHATERKAVPLVCFLVGLQVSRLVADGMTRADALAQSLEAAAALIPAEES